jgi:hypothetical protein
MEMGLCNKKGCNKEVWSFGLCDEHLHEGAERAKVDYERKIIEHKNHPLYIDAQNFWNDVQRQQIMKGMEKYPEPLNPESWTFEQLIEHAMQENVDQAHYLTALREKSREQDTYIKKLEKRVKDLEEGLKKALQIVNEK